MEPSSAAGVQCTLVRLSHRRARGSYTFSLTSDDGSTLKIDDALVVDNSGHHASQTKSGHIVLDRGPHPVIVEYAQSGGVYDLEWQWATTAGARTRSEAALSPYRIGHARCC